VLDALVIGAGVTGLYQLHRLLQQGFRVRLLEAGSGVGGTWFWNRYPGARLDSESYSYQYFHSDALRDEWEWSEEFAAQPELERYFNFAADKLGLRPYIELDNRVTAATFADGDDPVWTVRTTRGTVHRTRVLVAAVGILSAPNFPPVPGLDEFRGEWHHTALWPDREVSFADKRVAVIGTGSSGVQIVPVVAREAAHLTVFQRTPNWCTPINNRPITPETYQQVRDTFAELHATCMSTPGGFIHRPLETGALEVSEEERHTHFESLYARPGLTILLNNFRDISTNKDANAALTDFIRDKIRSRVRDPAVAAQLIPSDHTFGMKRPPLENNYFEVFNRPNVELICLAENPIVRFTETGLLTADGTIDVDVVILATGFDAVTGSLNRIDIRGTGGALLADHWADGPRTHLGLQSAGFPNLFFVGGPQSTTGNIPRATETQVEVVIDVVSRMREHGWRRVETTAEAEDAWQEHVESTVRGTVLEGAESWAFGSNVPGKRRRYLLYAGGLPMYRQKCGDAIADDYRGFCFG
jgi:cation diffusion facilitator CzcD-associated flavoprotein CzcO